MIFEALRSGSCAPPGGSDESLDQLLGADDSSAQSCRPNSSSDPLRGAYYPEPQILQRKSAVELD